MSMRGVLAIFCSLFCFGSSAQEFAGKFRLNEDFPKLSREATSYYCINPHSGHLQLFLVDSRTIQAFEFDDAFKPVKQTYLKHHADFSKNIIGSSVRENETYIYFTDPLEMEYGVAKMDFASGKSSVEPLGLGLETDLRLQTFTHDGLFYVLTVVGGSKLKLTKVDGENSLGDQEFDLKDDLPDKSLNSLVKFAIKNLAPPISITADHPHSFSSVSSPVKSYQQGDKIFITLDNAVDNTTVIALSVSDNKYYVREFPVKGNLCKEFGLKSISNSYLYGKALYQVCDCKEQLTLTATDIESGNLLKEYSASKDEDITFKNSQSWEEKTKGTSTGSVLKVLSNCELGLDIRKTGDLLEITTGCNIKELEASEKSDGSDMAANMGGFIGEAIFRAISGRTEASNEFSSFFSHRTYYLRSLMNPSTLDHIAGTPPKHPFDQIKNGFNKLANRQEKEKINTKILFKRKGNYYYGFLRNFEEYVIYKMATD